MAISLHCVPTRANGLDLVDLHQLPDMTLTDIDWVYYISRVARQEICSLPVAPGRRSSFPL